MVGTQLPLLQLGFFFIRIDRRKIVDGHGTRYKLMLIFPVPFGHLHATQSDYLHSPIPEKPSCLCRENLLPCWDRKIPEKQLAGFGGRGQVPRSVSTPAIGDSDQQKCNQLILNFFTTVMVFSD
jgi:hypothetical protein